jgi:hypothetical protein
MNQENNKESQKMVETENEALLRAVCKISSWTAIHQIVDIEQMVGMVNAKAKISRSVFDEALQICITHYMVHRKGNKIYNTGTASRPNNKTIDELHKAIDEA